VNVRTRALLVMLAALLAAALAVSGCSSAEQPASNQAASQETTATDQPAASPSATNSQGETLYTPAYVPNGKETATFTTNRGVIVVKLFGEDAPIHVGNFVELARKGFYDNTKFHRYEPGFVVQGGDPQTQSLTSEQVAQAVQTGNPPLGTGGPGYVIKGEFDPSVNPNKHLKGALGMARTNDPDSAGSQFYFALEPLAMLDGQYTVFGTITQGQDVADALRIGDTIESVTIENAN
jgi:peptidyl-prolyl cis-trans isomerase B (cyclophilin B)